MIAVVDGLVFAGALMASLVVFGWTLLPAVPRIVALLRDGVDPAAPAPVHSPAFAILSEPRLRARTAAMPAPPRLREAA